MSPVEREIKREIKIFSDVPSTRPLWMRAINTAGRIAPNYKRPSAKLWWDAAIKRQSGDPGKPGEDARQALTALTESINAESKLNLIGKIAAYDDTVRMACNHLRIANLLHDRPEILSTELPAPVFIIGLPRTGTTALHQLMSQDKRSRTIPYWESFDPIPPNEGPDRRVAKVDKMLRQLEQFSPDYHAIHPMTAEMAEECVALFMNELRTLQFDIQYYAPSYVKWLLAEDARIAYEGYLRQLQIIQFYRPTGERLVLKDPTHLVHLDTVLKVFPNAKIIFTHRDPASSLSSVCSLYAHTRAIFSDDVHPHLVGKEIMEGYWPKALDRAQIIRGGLAAEQCVDVRQADLSRDPIATIKNIYEVLRFEFDDAVECSMQDFLQAEAVKNKNSHRHSAEDFGLTVGGIRERFKGYIEDMGLIE